MSQLIKLEAAPDLVDQVYRALLDAISDGSLAPGTRITQQDIAAQLSVSRQPVLQAPRHGCCAASELCARVSVGRAPSDCRW